MADKTVYVQPVGDDRDDHYHTLAAAISGELIDNANLVVMSGILYIQIRGDWSGGADTTTVSVDGFTTSSDYYVRIYTDSANKATASSWDTGRYRLEVTDNDALAIIDEYTRIDGLQLRAIYSSVASKAVIYFHVSFASTNYIINCRIRSDSAAAGDYLGIFFSETDTTLYFWNNIVYNADTYGIRCQAATNFYIYNCTVYNCTGAGISQTGGTVTVKNTAVLDTGDDFAGTITIDYCASDDNDGTNNVAESGGGAGWPNDFEGAATGDFRLKSTSNLVGAALDDPSTGLFSNDIEGTTRSDWDVGAYEYTSGASGLWVLVRP